MRMVDLIETKKHGGELTDEEIRFMIREYVDGRIPDYQMSAMTMAIWFRGMTPRETAELTLAMEHSGDVCDLSAIHGIKVDKHSSGGVGDKTSIALVPWVAACGAKVAKMSGRGLGFTGGTLDKLESFTGFRAALTTEEFASWRASRDSGRRSPRRSLRSRSTGLAARSPRRREILSRRTGSSMRCGT